MPAHPAHSGRSPRTSALDLGEQFPQPPGRETASGAAQALQVLGSERMEGIGGHLSTPFPSRASTESRNRIHSITKLPSTFRVLHNDKSGGVTLPRGTYRVTSPNMTCTSLGSTFATFLAKYNGKIPGWTATARGKGNGTYRKNSNGLTFTVQLLRLGAKPPANASCKSTFMVLHNDKSGGVTLPRGTYRVTSPTMTCTSLGSTFATFFAKYNGKIPGWTATAFGAGHGKYRKNSNGLNFTVQLLKSKKK